MPDDLFGLEGSKMGGAGVSCARKDEEARFGKGFPVEVSLGGSFGPCVLGFIGKVVFGSWEDLRSKFRKGFPCLEVFFV